MNNAQLFLNGQQVDLSTDDPVALTFQINDLAEVKNQQGNTSNQFKLPLTTRNRKILGFPDDVAICNNTPYTRLKALFIQDGIEVFANAIAEINGTDETFASLTLLSGNVDFFDQIGGQLADMGDSTSQWSNYGASLVWKPYDHTWNLQNVAGSQQNTCNSGNNGLGGWIYPVVDYGILTADFTQPLDVRYMRPGFFIKTAIDLLLKITGYTAKGSLLKNPLYPLLIAQFSNSSFEHGKDYQNQQDVRGVNASLGQQVNVNHPYVDTVNGNGIITIGGSKGTILFSNVIANPSGYYNPATGIFTSNEKNSVTITVQIPSFYFYGHMNSSYGSNVDIAIYYIDPVNGEVSLSSVNYDLSANSTRVPSTSPFNPTPYAYQTTLNKTISFETQLPVGGQIRIGFEFKGYSGSRFSMAAGAQLVIKSNNQQVLFGQTVQCERIFPDMSQKDLIKDTLQRFGIICQTDVYSATINFASLKDIINNIPNAKDWTKKCVNQGKNISFQLGNYSQVNYLEYQTDPNQGKTLIPLKYGWSKITIDDKTLSPYASDLIISPFGASLNSPYYGGSTALIQMIDLTQGQDFSINVAPRILISNKVDLLKLGKKVTFTDDTTKPGDPNHNIVVNDVIDCPYFYKPGGQYSLMWEDLRLLYYPELEQVLKQCKKVTRYFMLTPRDIHELDLLIPIYLEQDGCYYYINKIDSWIKNHPVKVELIKIR